MRLHARMLCLLVLTLSASALYAQRTSTTIDRFDAIIEMSLQFGDTRAGAEPIQLFLAGPVVVQRSAPVAAAGAGSIIPTEILSMDMTGSFTDPGGRFAGVGPSPFRARLKESARQSSKGEIRTTGKTFEGATSFFDVFVEVEIGGFTLVNNQPIRIQAVINSFPPQETYSNLGDTRGLEFFEPGSPDTSIVLVLTLNFSATDFGHLAITRQLGSVQSTLQELRWSLPGLFKLLEVTISGTIKDCSNNPVPGVEVLGLTQPPPPQSLLGPNSNDTTDSAGAYSFKVPYGVTGQVSIPALPLAQPDKPPLFSNLTSNHVINFTSTLCR